MVKRFWMAAALTLALAACNGQSQSLRSLSPIPPATMSLMADKGMSKSDPILIRTYKKESELELWKKGRDGKYALLKTFPICRWSGQLGPKQREGDRQAPEGFYSVTPAQMNPNSAYYLSFDTGYPNAFDRSHGRTGSQLMVHGTCSSRGCFAMTDQGIAEIYAVAREAFAGGQRAFQFQSYPFRMTAQNLAKHRRDPNMPFWRNLKEGADTFEVTREEPRVAVCGGRYSFDSVNCRPEPTIAQAVAEKDARDQHEVAELVAKGTPAIQVVYDDGAQHQDFRSSFSSANLGTVSRPDGLASGPREIAMNDAEPAPAVSKTRALAFAPKHKPLQTEAFASAKLGDGKLNDGKAEGGKLDQRMASGSSVVARVASADPSEPLTTASTIEAKPAEAKPAEAKPFYRSMLSSAFGSDEKKDEPSVAAAPQPIAPAAQASVRPAKTSQVKTAQAKPAASVVAKPASPKPAAKPAAVAPKDKHAELKPATAPAN